MKGSESCSVVVLAGLPGAGKTTIADQLRERHGYTVLSRDAVKRALFGFDDVGEQQNAIAFDAMLRALPVLVRLHRNVVVDGMPFDKEGQSERVTEVLGPEHLTFVFVDTPLEVAKARLSVPDPSGPADRGPELVTRIAQGFRLIPVNWRRINGVAEPSANADTIASAARTGAHS